MEFSDAYQLLRESYLEAGLDVTEEGTELVVPNGDRQIRVVEDDIATYAEQYPQFDALKISPHECAICSSDYREHVVTPIENAPLGYSTFRLRDGVEFAGEDEGISAEVGPSSDLFKNRLRFTEGYIEMCIDRMRRPLARRSRAHESEVGYVDFRDVMYDPLTVKIRNLGAPSVEQAIRVSTPIIEACLFELSYLREAVVGLSEEWPRRQAHGRPFRIRELDQRDRLPLPNVMYNPDIVRFYQRGVSTRDPFIQFLSFYQVLEYFFLSVSDERLYETLSHRLNDPAFKSIPKSLDRLIQDVLDHRRIIDETEMLRLVLERYVESDELIDFITRFEEHFDEKHYTKRKQMFGNDMSEIRFEEQHLWGNVAKRIKVVRNAIVHSSDRHERTERYVPLTARAEDAIRKEIPLMKYLAERIVISTAVSF